MVGDSFEKESTLSGYSKKLLQVQRTVYFHFVFDCTWIVCIGGFAGHRAGYAKNGGTLYTDLSCG